jgi:TrpR-related protein YerC/YecD
MHPINKHDIDDLYGAILTLRTKEEARKFFRDLCTTTEIREFAERWKTARMIMDRVPYTTIIGRTGLSSTTVARVARWVKRGTGGYRMVLRRTGRTPG